MPERPFRVAIIGAGPAGTTLAALLARKGVSVAIFDDGKRPDLIVGESLIPLMVTIFQRLGLEERVRSFGVRKPGVTFTINDALEFPLSFSSVAGLLPEYAYNVPRREFDALLLEAAREAGARYVPEAAVLEKGDASAEVRLGRASLAHVPEWGGATPDLLVDASGRRRLFGKLLGIETETGPRKDVAHFAHFTGCEMPQPEGQVIIGRLRHGWSWRIPLNEGRLSIGVVMNKEHAREYGTNAEEVLDAVIRRDTRLARACADRVRVSPLATYTNYQLISRRGCGPGWVMAGDAFGFADPMLSPGLAMAMLSAEKIADLVPPAAPPDMAPLQRGLEEYAAWFGNFLTAWQELIDLFYDGRMFALYQTGSQWSARFPGRASAWIERHMSRHIAGMCSGACTTRAYSRNLVRFATRHGLRVNPDDFKIS